jgi:hypothetical protein
MRARLSRDFERFGRALPADWAAHVRDAYAIDLSAEYLGERIAHPIGKASGQLSLNAEQLEADAAAGLAFAVLKTAIGEDATGARSMDAWATQETRMRVERRRSADGRDGWTVTWKGRGWGGTLDEYLALVRAGRDLTGESGLLVVPSLKLDLPPLDQPFREEEYRHSLAALRAAWGPGTMLVEKDFSPTLAGDPRSEEQDRVLRWLRDVPEQVRSAAPGPVRVALKLMNARFDDAFQLRMLAGAQRADAVTVFNRLWDASARVAYGGWDLSDRNLRVLAAAPGGVPRSGTGNVCTGRMIAEYARRGCTSVQIHTFLQLPLPEYPAAQGTRTARALHALIFDPANGLVSVMLELEAAGALARTSGELRFMDLAGLGTPA